jgi:hypothetical protein
LGAGGALGGPARPGGNFGGKTPNLGAAPHDWGFAKKIKAKCYCVSYSDVQLKFTVALRALEMPPLPTYDNILPNASGAI